MNIKTVDIFCEVIDNFGDAGVVYRTAKEIKRKNSSLEVRIFINRLEEIASLNKKLDISINIQSVDNISFILIDEASLPLFNPGELIIEAFGCSIPESYLKRAKKSTVINLEYLSSEEWTVDFHLKESLTGMANIKKYFFMPGFLENGGGVLIDREFEKILVERESCSPKERAEIYKKYIKSSVNGKIVGTLFSYEHNFSNLAETLLNREEEYLLIVMGDKSKKSIEKLAEKNSWEKNGTVINVKNVTFELIDFINQEEYDTLISFADFNFVRGEESLVRSAVAGVPFIWHIYLQEEYIHMEKLKAFLNIYANYGKDKKIIEKYYNLLYNYNYRSVDSFEIESNEEYAVFFEHLEEMKDWSKSFSRYLREKCNLIDKLFIFLENEKI